MLEGFISDPNFWAYFIPMVVVIVISWIGYFGKWYGSLSTWGYAPAANLIVPLVGTVILALFAWGAYEADKSLAHLLTKNLQNLMRMLYGLIIAFLLAQVIILFFTHNIQAALFCNYFIIAILIGLIFEYSRINLTAAWLAFLFFLWIFYNTYSLSHLYLSNADSKLVTNQL